MISFRGCSVWYGEVIGMNDITVEIGPGVTALLGQNGAGKTTMMRLITGQLRPTTGECRVFGMDPFANTEVYKRLGYVPDIDNFPEHLSGREFVYRMARLQGFTHHQSELRTEEVLQEVGMADRGDKRLKSYSKGMRQRIKLAQAMLHNPDIVLLDEPLNGLDPLGRREYMDYLHRFASEGRAVVVSSHILFEVEQMTRSMMLMHRGRMLASGNLRSIRDLIDRHPHRIRILTEHPREVASKLVSLPYVISAEVGADNQEVEIRTKAPGQFYDELPGLVLDHGLQIY
ncbi:MAG TPA: ABC transporter ATP-binding protein, partial [Fimbriimonadaceae bacterium]|nr:ABC transporter ATP-binding protein [Fimbriimonadaceae bacterium]